MANLKSLFKNKKEEIQDNWIDSVFLEDITSEILSEISDIIGTETKIAFDGPFVGDVLDEIEPGLLYKLLHEDEDGDLIF